MTVHRWPAYRLAVVLLATASFFGVQAQVAPSATTVTPVALPTAPATPLTVEDAVAFALQHNPSITLGVENVQIAQQQVTVAHAAGLPTVGVNLNGTYTPNAQGIAFKDINIPAVTFSSSAQATAAQPIWPPAVWRAPVQVARAGVGINQQNLTRTQQAVAFQTRQAFFQLLSSQELLGVAQYSVTVAEDQLRLANATFTAGTAPKLDVLQAEATRENALVNLARAQNTVDISRATLATQLGLSAGAPITIRPPDGLPVAPAQVEPLVTQAYTARPEMQQLNFQRQQIRANMDLIRLQQEPTLSVQAAYSKTLIGGSIFGTDGLSLSAVIAMNLFNGGKTRAQLATARIQLQQVDTTAQQLEVNISLDVRQSWLNLQNALTQLNSAQKQSVAADEALRIARLRYSEGEGILLEVEQAYLNSTQARTSVSQARFQAEVAAAQLELAIGAPPTAQLPTAPVPAMPALPALPTPATLAAPPPAG